MSKLIKILCLDRDGTIIKDKGYMYKPQDIEFIAGSIDALRKLQDYFALVIVTNQSGIGRGHFKLRDYEIFNKMFLESLIENGVNVKASLVCPHNPEDNCDCRKPKTKLIDMWLEKENIELDMEHSYVIGDKLSDIELANNLGIRGILISKSRDSAANKYKIAVNLCEAMEMIL